MREIGAIVHIKEREKKRKTPIIKKKKVTAKQKEILKLELDEWIEKEEKRALARKKIVKNNLTKI